MAEKGRAVCCIVAAILGACAPHSATPSQATPPSRAAPPAPPAIAPADVAPRLSFELSQTFDPTPALRVVIEAAGPPEELRAWLLSDATPSSLQGVTARDGKGILPVDIDARGGAATLSFRRAVHPPLHLVYLRQAEAFSTRELRVASDPNRFAAAGQSLLALPVAWSQRRVPTTVVIDTKPLGPDARAASSLGVGQQRTLELSAAALRRCFFIAGPMGHAVLDGPEGHDEVAWLGYTSFDPRSVAAEVATFRTAAREYLGEKSSTPFTLLLLTDSRKAGDFSVARRTASALLQVSVNEPYGAPVRVSLAHQLLREWLGPMLWIGPDGDREPGQALWFVEGVSRYLARELSFRFGLLTPSEYLAEANEMERMVATSELRNQRNAELGARASEPAVAALLVARGARHAARVDALIRAKSKGKRSFDPLLRGLYADAQRQKGPLPESAWTSALERELGPGAARVFSDEILAGKNQPLPGDALGPCFGVKPARFESFALGFELDGPAELLPRTVNRVTQGSAAERAGLRAGDHVVELAFRAGSPRVAVELRFERSGANQKLSFLPLGAPVSGHSFVRAPGVADERCVRR